MCARTEICSWGETLPVEVRGRLLVLQQRSASGISKLPLYPVGTDVGVKMCCAECCRKTFNVRPGFTCDGIRMSEQFAKGVN